MLWNTLCVCYGEKMKYIRTIVFSFVLVLLNKNNINNSDDVIY